MERVKERDGEDEDKREQRGGRPRPREELGLQNEYSQLTTGEQATEGIMRACTWVVTQRMTPDSRKDKVMLNATKKGKKGGTAGEPIRGGRGKYCTIR